MTLNHLTPPEGYEEFALETFSRPWLASVGLTQIRIVTKKPLCVQVRMENPSGWHSIIATAEGTAPVLEAVYLVKSLFPEVPPDYWDMLPKPESDAHKMGFLMFPKTPTVVMRVFGKSHHDEWHGHLDNQHAFS